MRDFIQERFYIAKSIFHCCLPNFYFLWKVSQVNLNIKFLLVRFPPSCKGEVRWMFQHLDTNADSKLSLQELYDLEHDQNEICLKPFLQQCDVDRDVIVTPSEWCRCFQRTERPCAAVKRKITADLLGLYSK